MMDSKCRILVPIGCRSDEGLSAPVIRRLEEAEWCEVDIIHLDAADYQWSYTIVNVDYLREKKPDLVLITGDRIEMAAAAQADFLNNIPIAHLYAGIVGNGSTHDDLLRHQITIISDIALCEDKISTTRVKWLWSGLREQRGWDNIHVVGITHLDDLELDESLVPEEPYDLVLINPTTIIEEIVHIESDFAIIIAPNPDNNELQAVNIVKVKKYLSLDTIPRPQFLGLMKNCERFISNSSCVYYEAPHFLKPEQIILIGDRNSGRSTPKKLEMGASDKIVEVLKNWWKKK